jgi:sigma-B regulation protein RsbU (phosphoserine phosphatase)
MAIENARLHQRELAAEGLERELNLGREIQLSLLPDEAPQVPGWEFATYYEPAWEVGGDFYECQPAPGQDDEMDLVVADVAGKGVPAALFMALSQTILRSTTLNGRDLAAALRRANDLILHDNRADLFLTAFYARLNTRTGHLRYVNAGHNPPLWQQSASGQLDLLPGHGTALGVFDETWLEEYEIQMAPGDCLVLYTDGVTEAMNAARQQFEDERLQAVVAANAGASAQTVQDAIVQAVQEFRGDTAPSDDLTLCVVRRLP